MIRVRSDRSRWGWNCLGLLFLVPLLALVVQAASARWFFPQLLPEEWQPELVLDLLERNEVRSAIESSASIAVVATLIALIVGLPAAWVLGTRNIPGRSAIVVLLIMPQLLPPLTASMGLSISFLTAGVSGGFIPVVIAHVVQVLPFVVGISALTFSRLDQGYVAVGQGLGLPPSTLWRYVVWPMTRVGVLLAAYVGFVISWSQYLITLFVGGGRVITLPMLVLSSGSGSNVSIFAALAFVMSVVPMALFLFAKKGPQGATV